jgi:hypothetical protein
MKFVHTNISFLPLFPILTSKWTTYLIRRQQLKKKDYAQTFNIFQPFLLYTASHLHDIPLHLKGPREEIQFGYHTLWHVRQLSTIVTCNETKEHAGKKVHGDMFTPWWIPLPAKTVYFNLGKLHVPVPLEILCNSKITY